jgi:hypothetical protein
MSNDNTTTTTFAATVRETAPGRDQQAATSDDRSNAEFARAIRAAAPGRAVQR